MTSWYLRNKINKVFKNNLIHFNPPKACSTISVDFRGFLKFIAKLQASLKACCDSHPQPAYGKFQPNTCLQCRNSANKTSKLTKLAYTNMYGKQLQNIQQLVASLPHNIFEMKICRLTQNFAASLTFHNNYHCYCYRRKQSCTRCIFRFQLSWVKAESLID